MPDTTFTRMQDATREDYQLIGKHSLEFFAGLPDRILRHLELLDSDTGGYAVTRLTHSLQTATRAERDGRDQEYVVCALLHDLGDSLGSYNHPEVAAAILKPFVSEANLWMVEKHGLFQSYHMFRSVLDHDLRDSLRSHRHFAHAEEFSVCYDNRAFDPRRPNRPIAFFEPMVHRLFARPRRVTS